MRTVGAKPTRKRDIQRALIVHCLGDVHEVIIERCLNTVEEVKDVTGQDFVVLHPDNSAVIERDRG